MKAIKRKVLDHIEPHNCGWIGTCYDHCICSTMPYFGIDRMEFVLSKYEFCRGEMRLSPIADERGETVYEKLGLKIENVRFRTTEDIMALIDCGIPILAGVDCYHLKVRVDTYKKTHAHHFLLIYGYDIAKKCFFVVDHGYMTSQMFVKMELPFEDLLRANASFVELYGMDDSAGKVVKKVGQSEPRYFVQRFLNAKEDLQESAMAVRDDFDFMADVVRRGYDTFASKSRDITDYLNQLMFQRNILIGADDALQVDGLRAAAEQAVYHTRFVFALIGKIMYRKERDTFVQKRDVLLDKIERAAEGEAQLHARLNNREGVI